MEKQKKDKWLEMVYQKICQKVDAECERIGTKIPYSTQSDLYADDMYEKDMSWWTNGFWSGILWQLYGATKNDKYRRIAENIEEKMDVAFMHPGLHHDVGFMWLHLAVADYRMTGSQQAKRRAEHAAQLLAGRFNPLGEYIRAWNGTDNAGWIIIDCLMNLNLLYWMSEESKDPRFAAIAKKHADTALRLLLRKDGSSNHIAILNPDNGELLETPGGQGYGVNSAWSRGQAWAIYGFALSYHHTKELRYLDAAKSVAHYFMANVALTDYLPLCDFRAPAEPVYYDATAGACAACGFLEIAEAVSEHEKKLYEETAFKIIYAMEEKFVNWNINEDGILGMGKEAYHKGNAQQSIIYGDYFFIEAILRMMNRASFLW